MQGAVTARLKRKKEARHDRLCQAWKLTISNSSQRDTGRPWNNLSWPRE